MCRPLVRHLNSQGTPLHGPSSVDSSSHCSVPNDAHLVGARGVSLARFEEIQNKPDAKTLKATTRAAERTELINSAISNGIPRDQAEVMADDFMNNKNGKQKFTKVKTEDGDIQMVPVEDEDDDDDDLETETLLSPDDSILILTGANASGKSVFLKSVAILVYMVSSAIRLICVFTYSETSFTGTHW
jgi:hypothetical protein